MPDDPISPVSPVSPVPPSKQLVVVPAQTPANTAGAESSSFTVQQSASIWGNVGLILGALIAISPDILGLFSIVAPNSEYARIGGILLAMASKVNSMLVDRRFIGYRSEQGVAEKTGTITPKTTVETTVNQ